MKDSKTLISPLNSEQELGSPSSLPIDRYLADLIVRTADFKKDYDQEAVPIGTFLDDPFFLGKSFGGQFLGAKDNYWRKFLEEIFSAPLGSGYWLICLKGPIGIAKTTVACAGMAYDIYRLLCLRDPRDTLGGSKIDKIEFLVFNATLNLAEKVVWNKLNTMFENSPYFREVMDMHRRKKDRKDTMFPKGIDLYMGSRIEHSMGRSVFEVIIDEANFEVISDQVRETFYSVIRRMKSRFMQPGGGIPGRIWIASSEAGKNSVLNKLIEEHKGQKGVIVRSPTPWEINPKRYTMGRFRVFKGQPTRPPAIIDHTNESLFANEPENIIEVPEEHRSDFEINIHGALRDVAGVSIGSNYSLFQRQDKLEEAFRVPLYFPEIFRLEFYDASDQIANKVLNPEYFTKIQRPDLLRFIHIDIGLTEDRLGFACCYIRDFQQVQKKDPQDFNKILIERLPVVDVEFAFGIEAKPGQQIPLFKVREFIHWLVGRGYSIGFISADGFESADTLQLLLQAGLKTGKISVDINSEPYRALRRSIYEQRVILPDSKLLKRELTELEMSPDGSKVDHPVKNSDGSRGSKDVADAVCGALQGASSHQNLVKQMQIWRNLAAPETRQRNSALGPRISAEGLRMFWPEVDWVDSAPLRVPGVPISDGEDF